VEQGFLKGGETLKTGAKFDNERGKGKVLEKKQNPEGGRWKKRGGIVRTPGDKAPAMLLAEGRPASSKEPRRKCGGKEKDLNNRVPKEARGNSERNTACTARLK